MDTIKWLESVPEGQRYAALKRLLIAKTRQYKTPLTASFELTPLCNLNCKMCYVRLDPKQMNESGRPLTAKEWIALAQEAKAMGVHNIRLTGGEALLREDFQEIYSSIHEMGIYVDVLSNGTLIDDGVIEFFKKYPPSNVQVSLYGLSNEEYAKVCGNEVGFRLAMSGVERLIEAKIQCSLATTLINESNDDYLKIHQFAKDNNIKHITGIYLHHEREDRGVDVTKLRISPDKRIGIEKKLRQIDGYAELDECKLKREDVSENEMVYKGFLCGGGRNSFHINWRGIMYTCPAFNALQAFPMRDGLERAWNELVQQVDSVDALVECQTCEYRDFCCTCAAMHYEDTKEFGKISPRLCYKIQHGIK